MTHPYTRTMIERKFSIYVSKEMWDELNDDEMDDINNQLDAVLSFAEQYVTDRVRGLKTKQGKPVFVFVDSED